MTEFLTELLNAKSRSPITFLEGDFPSDDLKAILKILGTLPENICTEVNFQHR